MAKATWDIVAVEPDAVTIRDLCNLTGGKSVTNDAENVVATLRREGLLTEGKRLFYYDTDMSMDEITWSTDGQIGFKCGDDRINPPEAKEGAACG